MKEKGDIPSLFDIGASKVCHEEPNAVSNHDAPLSYNSASVENGVDYKAEVVKFTEDLKVLESEIKQLDLEIGSISVESFREEIEKCTDEMKQIEASLETNPSNAIRLEKSLDHLRIREKSERELHNITLRNEKRRKEETRNRLIRGLPPADSNLQPENAETDPKHPAQIVPELKSALGSSKYEIADRDWTQYPLYSQTLRSLNFDYPVDQIGFYISTMTGVGFILRGFLRSWCVKEAAPLLEKGLQNEDLSLYRHCSGMNNEQLKDSMRFRRIIKLRSFALAGCIISGFSGLVQIKNRNRF